MPSPSQAAPETRGAGNGRMAESPRTRRRSTTRGSGSEFALTETGEAPRSSLSANGRASELIARNEEWARIGTIYAVPIIGLVTAGAGLLGVFGVITPRVSPLVLIGIGISILSGQSVASLIDTILGKIR